MNILLVVHQHLDPNAGASGATLRLGQQYQQQGHDVQYYSFDNLPRKLAKLQNGKVSELTKAVIFPEFVAGHLLKLTQKQSIDVVNASTGDAWLWGKVPWSQGKKRPLLVTQSHGLEHIEHLKHIEAAKRGNLRLDWKYPIYNGGFRLWEVHTSMRYSDLVFLLNREEFDYAVEDLRLPPEKAHVFPNGISDDFLNLPFEKTCPSTNETINIAQIGSYIPRKGIEYSAPALNAILLRYPHVRVAFFGTGC